MLSAWCGPRRGAMACWSSRVAMMAMHCGVALCSCSASSMLEWWTESKALLRSILIACSGMLHSRESSMA
eukprot:10012254-Prorocentrum_lima.AAC.1